MLKTSFVPVAIDQACQRRQKDAEGEFYRKIAGQGPRGDFSNTTQGFYIATAAGKLLLYNNNRDPEKLFRLMRERLREYEFGSHSFDRDQVKAELLEASNAKRDPRYTLRPPADGLVVRVHTKVLGGYGKPISDSEASFQTALGRDNLWVTAEEQAALVKGRFPEALQRRIARFHLVDNTRGEPPMWKQDEIRKLTIQLDDDGVLTGHVELGTADGKRGYQADLRGRLAVAGKSVTGFQLVALGKFFGEGRYTRNAPKGRFPLAVTFELADGSDIADAVAPQGARGWLAGYLK